MFLPNHYLTLNQAFNATCSELPAPSLTVSVFVSWSPRGLRRGSAAACLLGLRVRIPPGTCLASVSVVSRQVEGCATG